MKIAPTLASQIYLAVRNTDTAVMQVGAGAFYRMNVTDGGYNTGALGTDVFLGAQSDSTASGVNPWMFGGVVALQDINVDDYGMMQVYGYHPQVLVGMHGSLASTTPHILNTVALFDTRLYTISTNTNAAFRQRVLEPINHHVILSSISTVQTTVEAWGAFAPVAFQIYMTSTAAEDLRPVLGGVVVPLGNLNGGATLTASATATSSFFSASVKAFIRCI